MDKNTTPPIIPTDADYERFLREQIHAIHLAAQDAAKPFVDALVRLQMARPPAPIFITAEQAKSLGFPIRD